MSRSIVQLNAYFRCVYDTYVAHKHRQQAIALLSEIYANINFILEEENNESIFFLDVSALLECNTITL